MYALVENNAVKKYPYGPDLLRRDNPQVSFPKNLTDDVLSAFNVLPVRPTPYPQVDHTKNVAEGYPVLSPEGWVQVWDVTDATSDEISQRVADKFSSVRAERNQLLASCDWTQLPDAPVDASAWASYRQALRDITMQTDPFDIKWPTPP